MNARSWILRKTDSLKKACGVSSLITDMLIKNAPPLLLKPMCFYSHLRRLSQEANPLLGADPLYTATQVQTWQTARKTAIEPVFDLLSKLLSITGAHKPLPIRGLPYVATFLGLGVFVLQLAMLMNRRWGLPLRNITHIRTVFR